MVYPVSFGMGMSGRYPTEQGAETAMKAFRIYSHIYAGEEPPVTVVALGPGIYCFADGPSALLIKARRSQLRSGGKRVSRHDWSKDCTDARLVQIIDGQLTHTGHRLPKRPKAPDKS